MATDIQYAVMAANAYGNSPLDRDPGGLAGLGGSDALSGGAGDDILLGGACVDRYEFAAGDGSDTIVDADREVRFDGAQLTRGRKVSDGTWLSNDGRFSYARTSSDSGTNLVITRVGGSDRITVAGWQPGRLGITLSDCPETIPELSAPQQIHPRVRNPDRGRYTPEPFHGERRRCSTVVRKRTHDWRALLGGALLLLGSGVAAQSFDCASAQLPVEKIICGDADLSRADSALASQFKAAMEEPADAAARAALLAAQRAWLRQRNACTDTGCIARSYSERERAIAQGKRLAQGGAPTAQPPRAACYAIHSAGYPPLCRQLLENFNRMCDEPPLTCGFRVHPSMKDVFSLPDWEELDAVKNFDLVGKVFRTEQSQNLRAPESVEEKAFRDARWREIEPDVRRLVVAGKLKLARTRINIDNLGESEWVYRVLDLDCDPSDIDLETSYRHMALFGVWNEATGDMTHDPRMTHFMRYRHPFRYRDGYVYGMRWWGFIPRGSMTVTDEANLAKPICHFTYTKDLQK